MLNVAIVCSPFKFVLYQHVSVICFSGKQTKVPEVGDVVYVSSLGKQASVLKVEASKGLVLLQAGNMKLKLKFGDIVTQHLRTSKQ